MKFTEIKYTYEGKEYLTVERESAYTHGDITYPEGVLNCLESLTASGAVITDIFQHTA